MQEKLRLPGWNLEMLQWLVFVCWSSCRAFAGLAIVIRRDLVSEKHWKRYLVPTAKNAG